MDYTFNAYNSSGILTISTILDGCLTRYGYATQPSVNYSTLPSGSDGWIGGVHGYGNVPSWYYMANNNELRYTAGYWTTAYWDTGYWSYGYYDEYGMWVEDWDYGDTEIWIPTDPPVYHASVYVDPQPYYATVAAADCLYMSRSFSAPAGIEGNRVRTGAGTVANSTSVDIALLRSWNSLVNGMVSPSYSLGGSYGLQCKDANGNIKYDSRCGEFIAYPPIPFTTFDVGGGVVIYHSACKTYPFYASSALNWIRRFEARAYTASSGTRYDQLFEWMLGIRNYTTNSCVIEWIFVGWGTYYVGTIGTLNSPWIHGSGQLINIFYGDVL